MEIDFQLLKSLWSLGQVVFGLLINEDKYKTTKSWPINDLTMVTWDILIPRACLASVQGEESATTHFHLQSS